MSRPTILRALRALPTATPSSSFHTTARALSVGPTVGPGAVNPQVLQGIDGFLPKENFDRLQEWQTGLWERLQAEVRNNPALVETKQKWDRSGLDMTALISSTARDRSLGLAYNYGALLLNNSYFLEALNPGQPIEVPQKYKMVHEKVLAFADGMVGGGWIWIVRTADNPNFIDVVPSFGSGTLLVTNRAQRGREAVGPLFNQPLSASANVDTSAESAPAPEAEAEPEDFTSTSHYLARASSQITSYPMPLAVLNLFDLSFIGSKYGVWGKREYAKDWLKSLDWQLVENRNSLIKGGRY
ncbi:hypothetical protein IAT38_001529 [Cryptococcus sp. DSM 104549]